MNSNNSKRRILVKQKGNYENTETDLKATYKEAGLKKEDGLAPPTTLKVIAHKIPDKKKEKIGYKDFEFRSSRPLAGAPVRPSHQQYDLRMQTQR
jgi:hypothetical protein